MTIALLQSRPARPAATTGAAGIFIRSSVGLCESATSLNSLCVGPGQSAETRMPDALQLMVQRLGEGEHIGLAGIIDRHVRARLEGRGRGDVEDRARAALAHHRQDKMAELGQRADVEVDHLAELAERPVRETAAEAEAGIVDQSADAEALPPPARRSGWRRRLPSKGPPRRHGPRRPAPRPAPPSGRGGGRRARAARRASRIAGRIPRRAPPTPR